MLAGGALEFVLTGLLAGLSIVVGLHVGDPLGILLDVAMCVAAALTVRWPRAAGVVVGLLLAMYLFAPKAWAEMGEYASMVPILGTGVREQRRVRLAMTLGYGAILTGIQIRAYPNDIRWLLGTLIWASLMAVLWMLGNAFTAYRRAQEEARAAALTEQRLRLARDLHDSVARTLAQLARRANLAADSNDATSLRALATGIGQAASEMRWLLGALRDPDTGVAVDSTGSLAVTLKEVVEELENDGFTVTVTTEGSLDDVPKRAADILAEVVREIAANVSRHGAPAGTCAVVASVDASWADLAFINQIAPDPPSSTAPHLGLVGAAERLAVIGGLIDSRREGPQWITRVTVPTA